MTTEKLRKGICIAWDALGFNEKMQKIGFDELVERGILVPRAEVVRDVEPYFVGFPDDNAAQAFVSDGL